MTPNEATALSQRPEPMTTGLKAVALRTNFHWLWRAQTVSLVGSQISSLAFQVTAASVLHADAAQMGILTAAQTAPYMLLSLFVGIAVDRWPKRALLIVADLIRALILVGLSALAVSGKLNIETLWAGTFLLSTFNLVFDSATGAYVPTLVGRRLFLSANTRLAATQSGSEVVGPGSAGFIIQVCSAPFAILFDAASYLLSATCLWRIRETSVRKDQATQDHIRSGGGSLRSLLSSLVEGVLFVSSHPVLRAFGIWSAAWNFSWSAVLSVFVLYATRSHSIATGSLGLILAAGGFGGIVGAMSGGVLARRFTRGKIFVWAPLLGACGGAILLLADGRAVGVLLAVGMFFYNTGESLFSVNMQTTRQEVTPLPLMARMDTTMRFCFRGMASLGALAGGYVGSRFGLRTAILMGILGLFTTVIGLFTSPLSVLRTPGVDDC